jgi:uncharacterized protein
VIVDTGVLFALADRSDRNHGAATATFALPEPKIVPEPVVVEADWLIRRYLGFAAELSFLRALSEGTLVVESPVPADRTRAAELVATDPELTYVDATVIAIAERMKEPRIATLDRERFAPVVGRRSGSLELIP